MRPIALLLLVLAPSSLFAQANLFDHVYWQAYGNREAQGYGGEGMDTIGYVNGSIQHAVTIGEAQPGKIVSCYVYNRFKLDTTRHFEFPGQKVIRGDFNHDGRVDVACWDKALSTITILFGTTVTDSFLRAAVISDTGLNYRYLENGICVVDCDSDGYDDLIVSDLLFSKGDGNYVGRIQWFRGGTSFDTVPARTVSGISRPRDYVGGFVRVGAPRDGLKRYLAEYRTYGPGGASGEDTARIMLYPLGHGFDLVPEDTMTCVLDTNRFYRIQGDFEIVDVDNDSVGDLLFPAYDRNYRPELKLDPTVFAFKGGPGKYFSPSYFFHRPFQTNSDKFGTKIIDVGDVTGRGYHSLLITDPQAFQNDVGAVFLFNIGSALKDSCVAVAVGQRGSFDRFGIQAAGSGDVTGDNRADFFVGSEVDDPVLPRVGVGSVTLFSGDSSYGPVITGVHEPTDLPVVMRLDQNYPNPFTSTTDITFAITDTKLHGKNVTLSIFDALGRKVTDVFTGAADGFGYTIRVDGSLLPSGTYTYLLQCGDRFQTRLMAVVH